MSPGGTIRWLSKVTVSLNRHVSAGAKNDSQEKTKRLNEQFINKKQLNEANVNVVNDCKYLFRFDNMCFL